MSDLIMSNVIRSQGGSFSLSGSLICLFVAIALGLFEAYVYSYKSIYSKSFLITLGLLPAIVSVVIMLVNGNLVAGVAVAGTFSLVRFRSVPGTAKEIGAIFLSMATGLSCGMGYPWFAIIFSVIICAVTWILNTLPYGENPMGQRRKFLNITLPENLEYGGLFDDIFQKYTDSARMIGVRTTNLGSLNKLTYEVVLKHGTVEKSMIDEIRTRNGNLEVGLTLMSTIPLEL